MTIALYRKYRPLSLSEVIGQDKTIKQLQGALSHDKISHAYLFVGSRGCGKTSVARIFAHNINHFDYQLEDSYVDIIEIDAATFTGVDNIRELREKAMIVPTEGKYKVYIIDEVHMLSTSAFNALLKILEEPPEHVVFIMATTNPEKIPATILSRTQTYRFSLADLSTMQKFLRKVADQESLEISDDALKIIAERGGGSFRDSLSILDQLSTLLSSEQIIEEADIMSAIGIPALQEIKTLLSAYESGNINLITDLVSKIINDGITAEAIALELINQILQHPTRKNLHLIEKLWHVDSSFPEAKLTVALIADHFFEPPSTSPISPSNPVVSSSQSPSSSPDHFSKLRETLTKNAKQHKVEQVKPVFGTDDPPETDTPPPTLPEAVISTSGDFNFNGFIANIKNINPSLLTALKKSRFVINQNTLDIYPEKPVYWRILGQKNNLDVLRNASTSISINIKNPDDSIIPKVAISFGQAEKGFTKNNLAEDQNLASISAIMGEVEEITDNPF